MSIDAAADARYAAFMIDRAPAHPELSMRDALMRAAIEQGAHDGGRPKGKKDAASRNKNRPDERVWELVIYRAATYQAEVRLVGTRYYLTRLKPAEQRAILDAYRLACG